MNSILSKNVVIVGISGLAIAGLVGAAAANTAPQNSALNNPGAGDLIPVGRDIRDDNPDLSESVETVPVVETKVETETSIIPHKITYRDDATMPAGTSKTMVAGQDGEETRYYLVTYADGTETERELMDAVVTRAAVDAVIANGTKKPANTSSSSGGGTYVNSRGNVVSSPTETNNGGATAVCRDGSYSYSQSRRGTCSHHGGVAKWL